MKYFTEDMKAPHEEKMTCKMGEEVRILLPGIDPHNPLDCTYVGPVYEFGYKHYAFTYELDEQRRVTALSALEYSQLKR